MTIAFWKSKRFWGLTSTALALAPMVMPFLAPDADFWQTLLQLGFVTDTDLKYVHLVWLVASATLAAYGFAVRRGKLSLK